MWGVFKPEIRDSEDAEVYLWSKLVSELAELQQIICFSDLTIKAGIDKLVEESGDVWWYTINLCNLYGIEVPPLEGYEECATHQLIDEIGSALRLSAIALGEVCKKRYHGKNTDEMRVLFTFIIDLMALWPPKLVFEAMKQNMRKLNERHGTSYNVAFYQQNKKE